MALSREKKVLAICLAISAIATVIMVISEIISPETSSLPIMVSTGIVPIVLCIALISSKKDDKNR